MRRLSEDELELFQLRCSGTLAASVERLSEPFFLGSESRATLVSHEGKPGFHALRLVGLVRQNEQQSANASGSSEDRYELRRELGRGSVGIVFEAWDRLLKRKVALKRLRAGTDAGEEELLRIRLEAEAMCYSLTRTIGTSRSVTSDLPNQSIATFRRLQPGVFLGH